MIPTEAVHVVPDQGYYVGMLQTLAWSPEYEKMFWVSRGSTGEVVVLLKVSMDLVSWLQECVVPENP